MSAVIDYSELSYRPMNTGDLAAIMAIEVRAYPFPWNKAIFRDCIKAGYHCYVAERNGEISGYAVFINAAQECHLLNICIDPDLQGYGYGRQLLSYVLQQARYFNARCAFLEVRRSNRHAVQLYESEGFNEVGIRKGYYPANHGREDAVIYAKEL